MISFYTFDRFWRTYLLLIEIYLASEWLNAKMVATYFGASYFCTAISGLCLNIIKGHLDILKLLKFV